MDKRIEELVAIRESVAAIWRLYAGLGRLFREEMQQQTAKATLRRILLPLTRRFNLAV